MSRQPPPPQGEPDRRRAGGREPEPLEDRAPEAPDEHRAPVENERDHPMAGGAAPAGGQPEEEDLPAWLTEVVVMAEHVRAVLRTRAPLIGVLLLALLGAGWAGLPALPWLAGAMALAAGYIALRHAGAPVGSGLRPGAWAGLVLLVLDLALTPWGLAVYAGLRLAGAPDPLLRAGACAAIGALVGVGALILGLGARPRRSRTDEERADRQVRSTAPGAHRAGAGALEPRAVGAVLALTGVLLWLLGTDPTWWWVGSTALSAELGSIIALRVGARAHRR